MSKDGGGGESLGRGIITQEVSPLTYSLVPPLKKKKSSQKKVIFIFNYFAFLPQTPNSSSMFLTHFKVAKRREAFCLSCKTFIFGVHVGDLFHKKKRLHFCFTRCVCTRGTFIFASFYFYETALYCKAFCLNFFKERFCNHFFLLVTHLLQSSSLTKAGDIVLFEKVTKHEREWLRFILNLFFPPSRLASHRPNYPVFAMIPVHLAAEWSGVAHIRCKPRNGRRTAWLGVHPPVHPGHVPKGTLS